MDHLDYVHIVSGDSLFDRLLEFCRGRDGRTASFGARLLLKEPRQSYEEQDYRGYNNNYLLFDTGFGFVVECNVYHLSERDRDLLLASPEVRSVSAHGVAEGVDGAVLGRALRARHPGAVIEIDRVNY